MHIPSAWCDMKILIAVVPQTIYVESTAHPRYAGSFHLGDRLGNRMPFWRASVNGVGGNVLYSSTTGKWVIGGQEAEDAKFGSSAACLILDRSNRLDLT